MTSLRLITAPVLHARSRTIATALGIAVAIFTLTLTLTIRETLAAWTGSRVPARVVVYAADGSPLPMSLRARLERLEGAGDVQYKYLNTIQNPTTQRTDLRLWAVSDGYVAAMPPGFVHVSPDVQAAWVANRTGILIDPTTLHAINRRVGDLIDWGTGADHVHGTVVGLTEGTFVGIIVHQDSYALVNPAASQLKSYSVGCAPARCDELAQRIDDTFEHDTPATASVTLDRETASMRQRLSTIPKLFTVIGITLFLVMLIISSTNVAMSLRERTHEFATLRVLGFTSPRLLANMISESALVFAVGGLLGGWGAFVGSRMFDWRMSVRHVTYAAQPLRVDVDSVIVGIVLSVVAGIVVALIPALGVLRSDVKRLLEQ